MLATDLPRALPLTVYNLESNGLSARLDLTLKLRIPRMPRPALRAWQATGSAVLSAACKRNARRLLRDVSEAHAAWEPPP